MKCNRLNINPMATQPLPWPLQIYTKNWAYYGDGKVADVTRQLDSSFFLHQNALTYFRYLWTTVTTNLPATSWLSVPNSRLQRGMSRIWIIRRPPSVWQVFITLPSTNSSADGWVLENQIHWFPYWSWKLAVPQRECSPSVNVLKEVQTLVS